MVSRTLEAQDERGGAVVRFGILGAGNIARRFAASLAHEGRAELAAAACRSQEKASRFLAEVPCAEDARAYGGYDELLADAGVDAIYLALPHAYHRQWAIAALRAGKAVLCEKPVTLTEAEMAEVAAVAREAGVLFMEAMKPRFVPIYQPILDAIGEIGPIVRVDATLCNDMLETVEAAGSYHMLPGPGAGVLLDCGAYCASWIATFAPGVRLVSVDVVRKDGIDVYVDARLAGGDVEASLECAFDRAKPRMAKLIGERGVVVVEDLHRPQRAIVHMEGTVPRMIDLPCEVDDFFGEISHFVGLCEEGATESPLMSLDDSLACMRVLDEVRAGMDAVRG